MPTFSEIAARLLDCEHRALGPGAGDDEIAAAERALGVRIEGGYRQFLKRFGWGGAGHIEIYGLGAEVPFHLDVVRVTQSEREEMEPRLQRHLVPVMNDGGGNLYCLDTQMTDEPSIVVWNHTGGAEQIPEVEAKDFNQWLGGELNDLNRVCALDEETLLAHTDVTVPSTEKQPAAQENKR